MHAIVSAGIAHTVATSCTHGLHENCTCGSSKEKKREKSLARNEFLWKGCKHNLQFGINMAKSYVDRQETGRDSWALINLHNNKVGRLVSFSSYKI